MKYRGVIGYEVTVPGETGSDVYISQIEEHTYRGEVVKNSYNREAVEWLNDNIKVSNSMRIVADPFALAHCQNIKYCTWLGQKWTVTNVEIDQPNLILRLGGAYHEQEGTD